MFPLRLTVRRLLRQPVTSAAAVVSMALGIGAATAIFSVADAVLLRPLPYRDAGQLVMIWDQLTRLGLNRFAVRHAHYLDYRERNRVFEDIAAFELLDVNMTATGDPERIQGARVTPNFFALLGTRAAAGGLPEDENSVVLAYTLWQRRFSDDPGLVGRQVTLNGASYRVTGILPRSYPLSLGAALEPEVWMVEAVRPDPERVRGGLRLIARRKPDVSLEASKADLLRIAADIDREHRPYRGPKGEDAGFRNDVVDLRDHLYGTVRPAVLLLAFAVATLLAISCVNAANLLLARGEARRRDLALRRALGASHARLAAESLLESAVLAIGGGVLGALLAQWGIDVLVGLGPEQLRRTLDVSIDLRVLAFTGFISVIAAVAAGLLPAIAGTRASVEALHSGSKGVVSGGSARAGRFLIGMQAALCVSLLAVAGLLARSLWNLANVHPGFESASTLTLRITLPMDKYREPHRRFAFFNEVVERARRLPGVEAAGAVSRLPLSGVGRGGDPFSIEGRQWGQGGSGTPQIVNHQSVTPEYFQAMGILLLAGRLLTGQDGDAPVTVINQTMARGFWGGESPLGKRIVPGAPRPGAQWLTIVGVVGDVHNTSLEVDPIPQMYELHWRVPVPSMWLALRTPAEARQLLPAVRQVVGQVDPEQPVYDVQTMEHRVAGSLAQPRFQGVLSGLFAAVALLLSTVGAYGVLTNWARSRTRELGIRIALGASGADVKWLVLRTGMLPVLIGAITGILAAAAAAPFLSGLLFGVGPNDPLSQAAAFLIVTVSAAAACWTPARRAARVDPAFCLRSE